MLHFRIFEKNIPTNRVLYGFVGIFFVMGNFQRFLYIRKTLLFSRQIGQHERDRR